jgi:hypothetical protein
MSIAPPKHRQAANGVPGHHVPQLVGYACAVVGKHQELHLITTYTEYIRAEHMPHVCLFPV